MNIFTDANFAEALASGKPVLVDLWATWCGPCKMMAPIVEELAGEYDGRVLVGKMDIDENEDTPSDYGVMSIPTFLFFKNGQLVDRMVGACPKEELVKRLNSLL